MGDSLPPPSYSKQVTGEQPIEDAPPAYAFPPTFTIGSKLTRGPLVDSAEIKGHLALLDAFVKLRQKVDGFDGHVKQAIPLMPDDLERRWAWFIGLAVERFSAWCITMNFSDVNGMPIEDVLPPVDVMMVWHAYMLNPGWYAEDGDRLPPLTYLKMVGKTLAHSLHQLPSVLVSEPSGTRVKTWSLRTRRRFDPLEDAMQQTFKAMYCPTCRFLLEAPLMTSEGQGYLQQNFEIRCPQPSCKDQPTITKAVLAARKLAEDVVRSDARYLAGALRTPHLKQDAVSAGILKNKVLTASVFKKPEKSTEEQWIVSILKKTHYSLDNIRKAMSKVDIGRLISRILSAYVDDRMFSVELVGAVLRQGSFVKKMYNLLWTRPDFFESSEDDIALQHAVARYHAFLDLMSSSPMSFLVPTLDIDLAWHTHQLKAANYNEDCKEYVGRFVDHDDKIEESRLASSFDITCRVWQDRFGVRYTHCGCPLPGETIGQKLSRLVASSTESSSNLVPPYREDLLAATHPSDHNAVFAMHHQTIGELSQSNRRKKFEKRQKREQELAKSGKLDPKSTAPATGHDQAFLVPVPMYFMYGPVAVGCVAGTGSFVNSSGGAGGVASCVAGAGACGMSGSCAANARNGGGGGGVGGCGGGGSCGGGGCGG